MGKATAATDVWCRTLGPPAYFARDTRRSRLRVAANCDCEPYLYLNKLDDIPLGGWPPLKYSGAICFAFLDRLDQFRSLNKPTTSWNFLGVHAISSILSLIAAIL
jgi:hypothetical protein